MQRRAAIAVPLALAVAVAGPSAGSVSSAAETPSRVSQMVLVDDPSDVWLWSVETESYELWGTKADADVLDASVDHGAKVIRVAMSFDNLRKKRPATYNVWIKTKKMVRVASVSASKKIGWRGKHVLIKGMHPVAAPGFEHAIDYDADTVMLTLPRKLFDGPAWIKVKMRNDLTGKRLFTDNPHNDGFEPVFSGKIDAP